MFIQKTHIFKRKDKIPLYQIPKYIDKVSLKVNWIHSKGNSIITNMYTNTQHYSIFLFSPFLPFSYVGRPLPRPGPRFRSITP